MDISNDVKKRQRILLIILSISGLFSLGGLSLPFISVRLDENIILQLTGGNLYFTQSLTLTFGTLMVFTGAVMAYLYLRDITVVDIDKKLENVMVVLALSFMASLVGFILLILDIIDAFSEAASIGLEDPIIFQIGFLLSVLGPVILIMGFIYLGTTRKRIDIHLKEHSSVS